MEHSVSPFLIARIHLEILLHPGELFFILILFKKIILLLLNRRFRTLAKVENFLNNVQQ